MFSRTLPAPGTLINAAGVADPNGLPAPGFSGLQLRSNRTADTQRTRSNRGYTVDNADFYWSFTISYHPMTMLEWNALESFLYGHDTLLNPFYVTLPNYSGPTDSAFAAHAASNDLMIAGTVYAGETEILIDTTGFPNQNLNVGAFANIYDPDDALHKSTYKIARVETPTQFSGTAPAPNTMRVTLYPPVQRDLSPNSELIVTSPVFRVIQKNQIDPQFDENNIVTINLQVEEILP